MLATFVLAGCAAPGIERSSSAFEDTADTTSTQPPLEPAPSPSSLPEVVEGVPPEDAAEDDPVPQAVQPAARRSDRGAAPSDSTAANRIDIPKIGLSHRTFEGIDLATINRGPSHWPGTALPGQRGNAVYPGHRTTYTKPFSDIDKLVVGDEVTFTTPSGRFVYRVSETFIVGANDVWIADPTQDATFTIFACHPRGSARQRYVVKGKLTSAPSEPSSPATTRPPPPPPSSSTTTTSAPPAEQPPLIPGLTG